MSVVQVYLIVLTREFAELSIVSPEFPGIPDPLRDSRAVAGLSHGGIERHGRGPAEEFGEVGDGGVGAAALPASGWPGRVLAGPCGENAQTLASSRIP